MSGQLTFQVRDGQVELVGEWLEEIDVSAGFLGTAAQGVGDPAASVTTLIAFQVANGAAVYRVNGATGRDVLRAVRVTGAGDVQAVLQAALASAAFPAGVSYPGGPPAGRSSVQVGRPAARAPRR